MPTPEQLEAQADDLRELARQARLKADALATHLDGLQVAAQDEKLWKGPYPRVVAGDLGTYVAHLTRSADLLRADANAWDGRASTLDADADDLRREQERETDGDGH